MSIFKSKKWAIRWDKICRSWYKYSRNKLSVIGLALALIVIIAAIFEKYITPYPTNAGPFINMANAGLSPNWAHWLGTDQFGRDVLTRIIFSFRSAIEMGIGVLVVAVPIGTILGLIASYFKGWIEPMIMRVVDIFLSLPPLILALAVSAVLQPTLFNSMMAVTIAWWAWYARISYSMGASVRNEFYIQSAELIGASRAHILFKEILPNCLGPILTKMTLDMGWVILIGASLSFVGLGEQPPKPALGTMIADGAKYITNMWWLAVFPAIAIMIIVLSFNLIGDGVRDMVSTEEM
jgi:peptide/nickel transport system permease protein